MCRGSGLTDPSEKTNTRRPPVFLLDSAYQSKNTVAAPQQPRLQQQKTATPALSCFAAAQRLHAGHRGAAAATTSRGQFAICHMKLITAARIKQKLRKFFLLLLLLGEYAAEGRGELRRGHCCSLDTNRAGKRLTRVEDLLLQSGIYIYICIKKWMCGCVTSASRRTAACSSSSRPLEKVLLAQQRDKKPKKRHARTHTAKSPRADLIQRLECFLEQISVGGGETLLWARGPRWFD